MLAREGLQGRLWDDEESLWGICIGDQATESRFMCWLGLLLDARRRVLLSSTKKRNGRKRCDLTSIPVQSSLDRRKYVTSTFPTPFCPINLVFAPYPFEARLASPSVVSLLAGSDGLWQCQKSIISAQFSLGRSCQVEMWPAGRRTWSHLRQEKEEELESSLADHGAGGMSVFPGRAWSPDVSRGMRHESSWRPGAGWDGM